jgi:hypothetical protein
MWNPPQLITAVAQDGTEHYYLRTFPEPGYMSQQYLGTDREAAEAEYRRHLPI